MSAAPPRIPDYQLLRCIGRGGYGEVWLARGVTGLHRAVKIVHRASFSEDRPYEREFSGIKKFQAVSHAQENLVNILHVGRNDAEGYFFYVMELADPAGAVGPYRVPGSDLDAGSYQSGTLKHLLRAHGRLPVSECVRLAKGLAQAVGHLHANGLIHRDIKPSNVIFVNSVPKLADIGLIAGLDESRSFVGTEGFVPPEGPGTVGADLFALGRLLYEMATGRDRLDYPKLPEDFDQLPDRAALIEFNEIILKAGDPERSRRYESAAEIVRDLLLLEAGKSVRRLRLLETRFALALRTAAAAVVVMVLALGAWWWAAARAREARRNFEISERHRLAAESALREALLNEVRASRQSGWAGQRLDSLQRLRDNPAITNNLAFRNEAIACLALPDLRPWRTVALPVFQGRRLALDHNLTRYATNEPRGAIHVRATADDRLLQVLPSPGAGVYRMGFSDDGRRLGVSYLNLRFLAWELERQPEPAGMLSSNGLARAWEDLEEPARPVRVRLPVGAVAGAGVPGREELAVVTSDRRMHLLNPTNGSVLRVLGGDVQPAGVRFNRAGSKFAAARSNDCLIYRASTGETLFALSHPAAVTAVAWHPDGRRVATACYDFKIRLWDTVTGQMLSGFEDHEAEVTAVEFDDTGTLLATASWDRTTRLWAPESARALVRVAGSGNGLCLAGDGRRLGYSTFEGGHLVLLEVLPARERVAFERSHGIYGLEFSPDGRFFAAGSVDGVQVWQWPHFSPVATLPVWEGDRASFSKDGTRLYAAGRGAALEWPFAPDAAARVLRIGPAREVTEVSASHRAHWRMAANGQDAVVFTEARLRRLRRTPAGWTVTASENGRRAGAEWSPDGRWLAVALDASRLEVRDAEGQVVTNLTGANAARALFTPDQAWLMMPVAEGYRAYRTGTWEPGPLVPRDASSAKLEQMGFDERSALGVFRTSAREASLVDLGTWQVVAGFPVPLYTMALSLSPDGRWLGVATEKLGVQVWDLALVRSGLASMGLDWAPSSDAVVAGNGLGSEDGLAPKWAPWVEVTGPRTTNGSPELSARIPPRAAGVPAECLDLSRDYNGSLADGWIPGFGLGPTADHSLPIPTGTNRWGDVIFDVRGVIQLTSSVLASRGGKFPAQVGGLAVGRTARRIHFLHGTDWSVKPGTLIGGYVIRYVTGEQAVVPIHYGRDVIDWWKGPETLTAGGAAVSGAAPARDQADRAVTEAGDSGDETLGPGGMESGAAGAGAGSGRGVTNAARGPVGPNLAWSGPNPASRRQNSSVHVYRSSWENPLWDVPIQTVDFFSARTACGPFLLGITVE